MHVARCSRRSFHDSWVLLIVVANTVRGPLLFLQHTFGGFIATKKPGNPRCKIAYTWHLQGATAYTFLKAIQPYLRIKAQQVALGLQFINTIDSSHRYSRYRPDVGTKVTRVAIRDQLRQLNRRGPSDDCGILNPVIGPSELDLFSGLEIANG